VAVQPGARRLLAVVAAGNDDVLVDRGRRGQAEAAVHVAANAGLEIDRPGLAVAEPGRRLAALRVESAEAVPSAAEESRRRVAIAWPVGDAAPADRRRRGIAPYHSRGFRLERDDVLPRRHVHDPVDRERGHLQAGDAGVERPRAL